MERVRVRYLEYALRDIEIADATEGAGSISRKKERRHHFRRWGPVDRVNDE